MKNELQITESELSKTKNLLNTDQLNFLFAPTPAAHKYERPAKGGGKWTYVTGTYVKKILNLMFGWDWDFEVVSNEYNLEIKQAIILGRLTVRVNGQAISKMQFGRQDIKFKNQYLLDAKGQPIKDDRGYKVKDLDAMKDSPIPLDLGNDLKGATTDSLKKCAAEFGICGDVYAPNEYKAISIIEDKKELLPDTPEWQDALKGLLNGTTIVQIESRFTLTEENRAELLNQAV